MDGWAWEQTDLWLEIRRELPIEALLCVIHGRPPGDAGKHPPHASSYSAAAEADVKTSIRAPAGSGTPTGRDGGQRRPARSHHRQLGHANLAITSV